MLRRSHPRLDGNAAAGTLSQIFGQDMTLAEATCGHCGCSGVLAEATAEVDDAGAILLCRTCGHTLLTAVVTGGGWSLMVSGCTELRGNAPALSTGSHSPDPSVP